MSYKKSTKDLYYDWRRFEDRLNGFKRELKKLKYDPFNKNECYPNSVNRWSYKPQIPQSVYNINDDEISLEPKLVLPPKLENHEIAPPPEQITIKEIKVVKGFLSSREEEIETEDAYQNQTHKKARTLLREIYEDLLIRYHQKLDDFENSYNSALNKVQRIISDANSGDFAQMEAALNIINSLSNLPEHYKIESKLFVDKNEKILLLEIEVPNNEKIPGIVIGETRNGFKYASQTARKKLVDHSFYSIIIRNLMLLEKISSTSEFNTLSINVRMKWFDLATGKEVNGIIASLSGLREGIKEIDYRHIDPKNTFKFLKGISTPNIEAVREVKPIFQMNKKDTRFVEIRSVDQEISENANLAAMEWEDFEHLVGRLFELEFQKNGSEIRVTRASRDRGVDAVMFNPDPIYGGKFVLQAKRYTRTVDVAAVRDLYGTVINEGANRGILITTSGYGPDSYEFAKDKPISLIDGQHLLQLFAKHGYNYRINLDEARRYQID